MSDVREGIDISSKSPDEGLLKRLSKQFLGGGGTLPDDEYTYEDLSSEPIDPLESEIPSEEVMQVFNRRKSESTREQATSSVSEVKRLVQTRVKTLTADSLKKLEAQVNEYLERLETDSRLSNLSVKDVLYSCNNTEYTCMIVCKMQ